MNKTQRIKLETPIGSIESDSGNHAVDIGTIMLLSVFLYIAVKYIKNL